MLGVPLRSIYPVLKYHWEIHIFFCSIVPFREKCRSSSKWTSHQSHPGWGTNCYQWCAIRVNKRGRKWSLYELLLVISFYFSFITTLSPYLCLSSSVLVFCATIWYSPKSILVVFSEVHCFRSCPIHGVLKLLGWVSRNQFDIIYNMWYRIHLYSSQ